jgi:hypothetical protein
MTRALVFSLSLLAAPAAVAVEVEGHHVAVELQGVRLADKVDIGQHSLVLNGAGARKKMFNNFYVVSLYLPEKATTPNAVLAQEPRRIQLNMLRTMNAESLAADFDKGLRANNGKAELGVIKTQRDEFRKILKSIGEVQRDDVVTLDLAEGATVISVNGEQKGRIEGGAFHNAILKGWLGNKPVQPELKKALLGGP